MSEAKHTPGELRLSDQSNRILVSADNSSVIVGSASGYTGSGYFPDDETAVHNARRIVTAWNCHDDLLEACKELLKYSSWWTKERMGQYGDSYRPSDAEQMAEAAIAKAEGRGM